MTDYLINLLTENVKFSEMFNILSVPTAFTVIHLPTDLQQPFHLEPFLFQIIYVLLPSAPWDVVYFAEQMESENKIMQSVV